MAAARPVTVNERKATRERDSKVTQVGAGAEALAAEIWDSDPNSARIAIHDLCGDMATAYRAGHSSRGRDIYIAASGAHRRALAQGGDDNAAFSAAAQRVYDTAWAPNGVRTPNGGKARLSDGRTGAPWFAGQGDRWNGLKGRERTVTAGMAPGSAGKRSQAKAQARVRSVVHAADVRAEHGGPIERARYAAESLAQAIRDGASRSKKRALRARLHKASIAAGLEPRRLLRGALDDIGA